MASGIVESKDQGSSGSNEAHGNAPASQRGQLVQRLLAAGDNLPAFIHDLLTAQAISVAGTEAAAFIIDRKSDEVAEFSLRPIAHIRPDQSTQEQRQAAINAFQEIIRPCVIQNRDGAVEVGQMIDGTEAQFCLVTLLRNEGQVVAVSAVITRCRGLERAKQRLVSMQLVAGYFDLYSLRRASEQARVIAQSHQQVLQLAGSVATATGFEGAAMSLCNELAQRTGAVRVAIGWIKGTRVRVKALSHTEKFDKKQELIVALERAMEECVDQEQAVHFDPTGQGSNNVTRAARELSQKHGGNIVLSLPLRHDAEVAGVATLEFSAQQKLSDHAASGLAVAVDLLAPQLYDRYQNDRYLITKAGISARETAKLAIGPRHMLAKLLIIVGIAVLLVLCNWVPGVDLRPMYRVSAAFQFVPLNKQVVSAPYDGKVGTVHVKLGQQVKAGDLLMEMDAVELRLKRSQANSKAAELQQQVSNLRAQSQDDPSKIAEMRYAEQQYQGALEDVRLLDLYLSQAQIVAGIDGTVVGGDWTGKVGAPVRQGDEVFEIAEPGLLEAELKVADRDAQMVDVGRKVTIATSSQPQDKYQGRITRIVPLGEPSEGGNYFKVYAAMEQTSETWQPGLQGQARVDVEKRTLMWIWTHRVVEFVTLKLWM